MGKRGTFSYQRGKNDTFRMPHHAAIFSAVKWTNIRFNVKSPRLDKGDVVAQPVASVFGPGVEEVLLDPEFKKTKGFRHNDYWKHNKDEDQQHINELIKALSL